MPNAMMVNIKHEADDLGVDFGVDLYSGLQPPKALPEGASMASDGAPAAPPPPGGAAAGTPEQSARGEVAAADLAEALVGAAQGEREAQAGQPRAKGRAAEAVEAAVAEEESAGEETSALTTGAEIDLSDTPDVPAVDLA